MNHRLFNATALVVGLSCAAVLLWVWRSGQKPAPVSHAPTSTAAQPSAKLDPSALASDALPALSAEARRLLADLQRLILDREARNNEGVLTFKDDDAMRRFLARAGEAGLKVIGQVDALRTVRVGFDDPRALRNELLKNAGDYESLAGNGLMQLPQPPKEDRAAVQQVPFGNRTLDFIGATGDRSTWGRGTTIAILDTGVAADTTFGAGRLRTLDIGLGSSPGTGANDGHGTSVASLAAGASREAGGVAPAANLLSIRVTDANGTSDIFTVSQAIVAAVDAGARIVNVSLGGYSTNGTLNAAISYATERGALIVAAAGNDQAAQLAWPAADRRVLSVGAVDAAEQQVSFSNSGEQLQLSAPGYGVQTAWLNNQRVYVDGTSASSPLVAGAVAALISQNPSLTPQQAAQVLTQTASDGGAPGADPAFGQGILNVGWAMNRNNPSYIDTAVASHNYDAANNQMQFTIQNRSGRAVSGMSLNVTAGTVSTTQTVPNLSAGESYVATVRVDDATLNRNGSLPYTTQLNNPLGVTDAIPSNNRKSTTLSAPKP